MSAKHSIIPVFIPHYGCTNSCVFCNQRRITGFSATGVLDVLHAVEAAVREHKDAKLAELAFYGGSFTSLPIEQQNEFLLAAQPFLSNGLNAIRVSARPDSFSSSDAVRLKGFGVRTVELGAQSMCDDVLIASQRGHTAADVARASKTVKNAGIKLILQMMTGLPADTNEKSILTAKRLIELEPSGVRIYPAVVIKGTELYEMWRCGSYIEHTVEDAVELCARIYAMFEQSEIPVIRMGLNPTEDLSGGDAVAGAYHPAFGELVLSRIHYTKAVELL